MTSQAFDELLLLKRGGRTIYHGPIGIRAIDLVKVRKYGLSVDISYCTLYTDDESWLTNNANLQYFEAIPGVRACPGDLNPATWMLEVSALGAEQKLGINFADVYDASELST